jgi:hypothetical protein
MDVADKGQKVVVFFAEDGFVPVFEQMPGSAMPSIIVLGIPGEEFSHNRGYAVFTTLKQNMGVIAHENPSVYFALPISDILTKALQESGPVLFVFEDSSFIDTPHHDMMQGTGKIQSGLPWHG